MSSEEAQGDDDDAQRGRDPKYSQHLRRAIDITALGRDFLWHHGSDGNASQNCIQPTLVPLGRATQAQTCDKTSDPTHQIIADGEGQVEGDGYSDGLW